MTRSVIISRITGGDLYAEFFARPEMTVPDAQKRFVALIASAR